MSETLQPSLALSFLETLNSLQCPYTQDVDESYMGELLLSPGEHRIRLLLWIFGEVHADLEKMMTSERFYVVKASDLGVDKRVQVLTGLSASFGLCRAADFDLVRGKASNLKQISFWKKLFSIVQHAKQPSLYETHQADKHLADEIMQTKLDLLHKAFSNHAELLPHDLIMEMPKSKASLKLKRESFDGIKANLDQLIKDLETQQRNLFELENSMKYLANDDKATLESISRVLTLTLNDLDQILTTFDQVFLNSFAPYCNREPDVFGKLGPTTKIVSKQLSYVSNTFDNLQTIKLCSKSILECTKNWSRTRQRVNKLVEAFDDFWSGSMQCFDRLTKTINHSKNDVSASRVADESLGRQLLESELHKTVHDMSVIK